MEKFQLRDVNVTMVTGNPQATGKVKKYMPRLYTAEDFDNAVAAVKCGLSYRKASVQFGVPKSTLTDRIAGGKRKRKDPIFTSQEEEGFVEYFSKLAERECGVSTLEVRNTLKCWLDRNNRQVDRFKSNMPATNWVTQFRKRHPSLNIIPWKNPVKVKTAAAALAGCVKKVYADSSTQEVGVVHSSTQVVGTIYQDAPAPSSMHYTSANENVQSSDRPVLSSSDDGDMTNRYITSEDEHDICEDVTSASEITIDVHNVSIDNSSSPSIQPSITAIRPTSPALQIDQTVPSSSTSRCNITQIPLVNIQPIEQQQRTSSRYVNSDDSRMCKEPSSPPTRSKSYIALIALEDTLTTHELNSFQRRFGEPHLSMESEIIYLAWKVLKSKCVDESPTMVGDYLRGENHHRRRGDPPIYNCNKHISKPEEKHISSGSNVSEETMLQLQQIISKYGEAGEAGEAEKTAGEASSSSSSVIVKSEIFMSEES